MQSEMGRNEHELTFLRALQTSGHGSTRDALAAGVFAELVPTAMPFARALCVVVDYYLSEGRAECDEKASSGSARSAMQGGWLARASCLTWSRGRRSRWYSSTSGLVHRHTRVSETGYRLIIALLL